MAVPVPMLRPISVAHYLELMVSRGYTRSELLMRTAIELESLSDPNYLISHKDYQQFFENLLHISGDSGLGLTLGLTHEPAHFGVLAYAGLSCRTIRQGMVDIWARYGAAFGVTTRLMVVAENADTAVVQILAPWSTEATYRFHVEEALCVLLKIGGSITGSDAVFERLEFSYARPHYAARYEEVFGCPVSFSALHTNAVIRRAWLDSPLRTKDPELNSVCREHLERVLKQTQAASPTTMRLRHLLLSQMQALPSLPQVAQQFGMSARSLARQLQKEGYTYRQLTEELRRELALEWLRSSSMTTKEICFRLGFQDTAAFRRAFKDWTGHTPGEYRRPALPQNC
ncbi:MAG: AraC family transcriptional regulator [Steroidobacteraceae bacterium]